MCRLVVLSLFAAACATAPAVPPPVTRELSKDTRIARDDSAYDDLYADEESAKVKTEDELTADLQAMAAEIACKGPAPFLTVDHTVRTANGGTVLLSKALSKEEIAEGLGQILDDIEGGLIELGIGTDAPMASLTRQERRFLEGRIKYFKRRVLAVTVYGSNELGDRPQMLATLAERAERLNQEIGRRTAMLKSTKSVP